jgi:hypothetical protein
MIMGYRSEIFGFTEIFSTVPGWLVEFTGLFFDRALLGFELQGAAQVLKWGTKGYAQSQQFWPLLPPGKMTDGDPIAGGKARLWPFSPDMTEQAQPSLDVENDLRQKEGFSYAANGGLRRIALELMKNPRKENVRRCLVDFYNELT